MIVELYLAEPAGIMRPRAAVAIRARSLRSLERTRAFGMTPAEGMVENDRRTPSEVMLNKKLGRLLHAQYL
jgi:hypothetical protein